MERKPINYADRPYFYKPPYSYTVLEPENDPLEASLLKKPKENMADKAAKLRASVLLSSYNGESW